MIDFLRTLLGALVMAGFIPGLILGWFVRGGVDSIRGTSKAPAAAIVPAARIENPPPSFTTTLAHLAGGWRGVARGCDGCAASEAGHAKQIAAACRLVLRPSDASTGTVRRVSGRHTCCGAFRQLSVNEDVPYRFENFTDGEASLSFGDESQRLRLATEGFETVPEVDGSQPEQLCQMGLVKMK